MLFSLGVIERYKRYCFFTYPGDILYCLFCQLNTGAGELPYARDRASRGTFYGFKSGFGASKVVQAHKFHSRSLPGTF